MSKFSDIIKEIEKAESIAVFVHVNMDGDAVGSAFSFAKALTDFGKKATVVLNDNPPAYLRYFCDEYVRDTDEIFDLAVALDCGDMARLGCLRETFERAHRHVCIDHHVSNVGYGDVNYIKAKASSTSEIVYELIMALTGKISSRQAEQLYAGIITDTGGFKFSNTTPESFIYSAELLKCGADISRVCIEIYECESLGKLKLKSKALDSLKLYSGGKISSVILTEKDFEETGTGFSDCEGFSEIGRSVEGVEAAFSITAKHQVKVSLRSKSYVDVSRVAAHFGGGGHVKASGFTLPGDTDIDKLTEEIVKMLEKEILEHENERSNSN
ncbi:MAG: bifunctional oligoribonuclease/PAP phosphatase NrnA [Clostridia bacterium]|nr:bifunctional oligoribonuclease/PAP phosphatase NrnA [Clostridia bacterium]